MTIQEILHQQGFKTAAPGFFIKLPTKEEGYNILLEVQDNHLKFNVPCASVKVDYEPEIETFIHSHLEGSSCVKATFRQRMMELHYYFTNEEEAAAAVTAAQELIALVDKEYDLLSVCTQCGRIGRVNAVLRDGAWQTVCGVCADDRALHLSHERMNERNREKAKKTEKRPTTRFLLAGLVAGLWACGIGLGFTVINLLLSVLKLASVSAGAVAGFLVVRNLRRIYPKLTLHGMLLANLTALITIVIVSPLLVYLFCGLMELIMFNTASVQNPIQYTQGQVGYMILGLIVMGLSEFVAAYWLTEDMGTM